MKKTISKNSRLVIRSAAVTMFMISCVFTTFLLMGYAYSAIQMTAFGNDTPAFIISDWDEFTVFGTSYHVPVMTSAEKVYNFAYAYSPGIIKLIGFAINGAENLLNSIFG